MKRWLKYVIALVVLIGLAVGGYYAYSYYEYHFVAPTRIIVAFKQGTPEQQAIAILTSDGDTALPLHYDQQHFSSLQNYPLGFEYTVKGFDKAKTIGLQLKANPIVQNVIY